MVSATILYGHPTDANAFEEYYERVHMPLAMKMPNVERVQLTRFAPGPDGATPAYYRMAQLHFASADLMTACFGSREGQAAAGDLANFATGGATILIGEVKVA